MLYSPPFLSFLRLNLFFYFLIKHFLFLIHSSLNNLFDPFDFLLLIFFLRFMQCLMDAIDPKLIFFSSIIKCLKLWSILKMQMKTIKREVITSFLGE